MRLAPHEFIRRFLLHVLPDGFHRIRHYGFLASRAPRPKPRALASAASAARVRQRPGEDRRPSPLNHSRTRGPSLRARTAAAECAASALSPPSAALLPMRHVMTTTVRPCSIRSVPSIPAAQRRSRRSASTRHPCRDRLVQPPPRRRPSGQRDRRMPSTRSSIDSRSPSPGPEPAPTPRQFARFRHSGQQARAFVQSGLCEVASSDARTCAPATSHNPPNSQIR